jgi:hypothetical protein
MAVPPDIVVQADYYCRVPVCSGPAWTRPVDIAGRKHRGSAAAAAAPQGGARQLILFWRSMTSIAVQAT